MKYETKPIQNKKREYKRSNILSYIYYNLGSGLMCNCPMDMGILKGFRQVLFRLMLVDYGGLKYIKRIMKLYKEEQC